MQMRAFQMALCGGMFAAMLMTPAMAQPAAPDGTMYPLEAPAEPNAIPLNTGGVEGGVANEIWFRQWGDPMVRNVTDATLTPFIPDADKATGAAVIVAPGGGFMWLSMGNEGWEVAEALRARGVAAFVLKYRLRPTAPTAAEFETQMNNLFSGAGRPAGPRPPMALDDQIEDATAAFTMVRARAAEWHVDPNRIGMMGFSAGAGTTMATTLQAPQNRPAFIAPVYGGLNAVEVPADAPPMFVVLAADDPLFGPTDFDLVQSWRTAGRPVELHYYQNGGHGFGLGNPDRTSNIWFDAFMHWLEVNGFLEAAH
ncbi:MAG: alpha/beta hydrolase [Terricaulis sp.]